MCVLVILGSELDGDGQVHLFGKGFKNCFARIVYGKAVDVLEGDSLIRDIKTTKMWSPCLTPHLVQTRQQSKAEMNDSLILTG